jgi:hypothetical protein
MMPSHGVMIMAAFQKLMLLRLCPHRGMLRRHACI